MYIASIIFGFTSETRGYIDRSTKALFQNPGTHFTQAWVSPSRSKIATSESFRRRRSKVALSDVSGTSADGLVKKTGSLNKLQLSFLATKKYETKPVEINSNLPLDEFFLANRNLLLGNCEKISIILSEQNLDLLKKSDFQRYEFASRRDVLKIVKGGLNFPGLAIKSILKMEVLHMENKETCLPEIRFTLLSSEQIGTGAKPIVWLYNKLTGTGKKDGNSSESDTFSVTSITAKYAEDKEKILFVADCKLQIGFSIPASLFKLLPLSPAKFEESGSKSIQKVLDSDIIPSVNSFRDAFLNQCQ